MSKNFLSMNEELQKGDFLLSSDGEYKAVFQEDGNFVVYGWKPVWASNTAGHPEAQRLIMQGDCNFVMYASDRVVWATNAYRSNVKCCRLTLRNDGSLDVQDDGTVIWTSKK